MSEYSSYRASEKREELKKIDFMSFVTDFLHTFRRLWWIPVLLAAALAAAFYFRVRVSYVPVYTAEATVSVTGKSGIGYDGADAQTASQVGKVFPYILTSGALSGIVAEDLGMEAIPGNIQVTNIEGTNLLTIDVTADDGETAYEILQSVIKNTPDVAQYVVGPTNLEVIDDNGVPQDGGKLVTERGSIKKGAMAGILLGILVIVLYMYTFRTVRTEEDLKSVISAPCLGVLPRYRLRKRARSEGKGINILDDNPQQDYVEAMRLIRTRLERRMAEKKTKTLMVTSSIPGEGKSTAAANLAISMAKKGRKVILVDCDLRNPSLQSIFGVEGTFPGLAEVLRGKAGASTALARIGDDTMNLRVLMGASTPSEHVEILGSKAMGELIRTLRSSCDVLILDTPPSAMLVDAMMLVKHVDLALYVVMADYARRQYVVKGVKELSEIGIGLAGCILNGGTKK